MQQAIVTSEKNEALEAWGDRRDLREMADRIKLMLPYGAILDSNEALALAQASSLTGLNPFEGEIYFLKSEKTGESKGVYPGIKGRRRKAREQLERTAGRGANFWIEYDYPDSAWKSANGYADNWLVCRAILRDTATVNEYVKIVGALVSAKFSNEDIRRIAGERPYVEGIGFVKPGEYLVRPQREVAKKRAERAALAQRFDIGLAIKTNDDHDDAEDDTMSYVDDSARWELAGSKVESHDVDIAANDRALGRDDGDLTGAYTPQAKPTSPDTLDALTETTEREAVTNAPISTPETSTTKPSSIKQAVIAVEFITGWHDRAELFAAHNPAYQDKKGHADKFHLVKSAASAGFPEINAANVEQVLAAIVAAHEAKQA